MKYFLLIFILILLPGCSLVSSLTDEGDPPIIAELSVTPNNGPAPLLSSVNWQIVNTSPAPVTCILDFGNGETQTVENCSQVSDTFYTYKENGGYILVLTATQGRHEVKRSFPVTVQASTSAPSEDAAITELLVTPNNAEALMLSVVSWQVTGFKEPVTCDLNFGDGAKESVNNCSQVNNVFHTYAERGGHVLILRVKDGERELSKSVPVTVLAPSTP